MPFLRLLAALLPVPLLILGIQASLRGMAPAPASAQTILQRAAAVELPRSRTLHLVYRQWLGDSTGRYEVWEQTDRNGRIVRTAGTTIEWVGNATVSIERYVGESGVTHGYHYEPASKYLRTYTSPDSAVKSRSGPFGRGVFGSAADVAQYIRQLQHRSPAGVRLLPERRFRAVLVYPIHVDGNAGRHLLGFTVYIDAQSYILRGIEGSNVSELAGNVAMENQVLITYQVVCLSCIPPGTFQLHPPSGNQVLP